MSLRGLTTLQLVTWSKFTFLFTGLHSPTHKYLSTYHRLQTESLDLPLFTLLVSVSPTSFSVQRYLFIYTSNCQKHVVHLRVLSCKWYLSDDLLVYLSSCTVGWYFSFGSETVVDGFTTVWLPPWCTVPDSDTYPGCPDSDKYPTVSGSD